MKKYIYVSTFKGVVGEISGEMSEFPKNHIEYLESIKSKYPVGCTLSLLEREYYGEEVDSTTTRYETWVIAPKSDKELKAEVEALKEHGSKEAIKIASALEFVLSDKDMTLEKLRETDKSVEAVRAWYFVKEGVDRLTDETTLLPK